MEGFAFLGEELLHRGHVIELYRSRFRAPDDSEFTRDVVRHPGAVSVVAVTDRDEVVLVRQYRAPLDRELIELPAGKRDVEGEPMEVTANRELAEEVGLVAGHLEHLVTFHNSVGFCDEESHVFLGTDLEEVAHAPDGVEEEHMEVLRVPLAEAAAMIERAEITDGKTVIGLLAALRRLGDGTQAPRRS